MEGERMIDDSVQRKVPLDRIKPTRISRFKNHFTIPKTWESQVDKNQHWYKDNSKMRKVA